MISPIDRWTSKPNVAEKVTPIGGTSIAGVQNTFVTVLENIPCGFARTIEVFFLCTTQPIQHIVIRSYAANRTLVVDTQITGAVVANTTVSVTFNGPFGQSYDVLVQLKNGADTPAGTVATMWTAAKA
jgi:hypothetical protein